MCPSVPADSEGSMIIGVNIGTAEKPETAYLTETQAVTKELLDAVQPVRPEDVFRFSAPCTRCVHYAVRESKCLFAEKVVRLTPPAADQLPVCAIRAECLWWRQEGEQACIRCTRIIATILTASEGLRLPGDDGEI